MYFEENMELIEKMVALQHSRGYIFGTSIEYVDESSKLVIPNHRPILMGHEWVSS